MIYIKNITKTYNKETVLEIDYLEIKPGQTFGLVGNNGAGKTTLTKKIQQKNQSFKISVSHTTRTPRSNEIDGVDYFFVSKLKFKELIDKKKF